jgi:hypothetical protein
LPEGAPGQGGRHETLADLPPSCPVCGESMVRILYGYPMPAAWELVRRGQAVLGGCLVHPDYPRWSCRHKHAIAGTLGTSHTTTEPTANPPRPGF